MSINENISKLNPTEGGKSGLFNREGKQEQPQTTSLSKRMERVAGLSYYSPKPRQTGRQAGDSVPVASSCSLGEQKRTISSTASVPVLKWENMA